MMRGGANDTSGCHLAFFSEDLAVARHFATVQNRLYNIIPELLPAHTFSGCDTVAMLHGIGKAKMLKTVQANKCSVSLLGD